jgi:hypothetical protein
MLSLSSICGTSASRPKGIVALTFGVVATGMSQFLPTDLTPHRYKRHRFPAEIIAHAAWLYYRSNSISSTRRKLRGKREYSHTACAMVSGGKRWRL